MSSPVPCKICGALPDVIGTPVENCDVFDYFARCSNDNCGFCPAIVDKEIAITIWDSNNGAPATQINNPLVDAALTRDHCWHERREAASFCCDCEGLRDFLHSATPSPSVREAAEEIRNYVDGLICAPPMRDFERNEIERIINKYFCSPVSAAGGDEDGELPIEDLERDHYRDHPPEND